MFKRIFAVSIIALIAAGKEVQTPGQWSVEEESEPQLTTPQVAQATGTKLQGSARWWAMTEFLIGLSVGSYSSLIS